MERSVHEGNKNSYSNCNNNNNNATGVFSLSFFCEMDIKDLNTTVHNSKLNNQHGNPPTQSTNSE